MPSPLHEALLQELAVLSAIAHGDDADVHKVVQIALAACEASLGLDDERSKLYRDVVMMSLGLIARQELQSMDLRNYEYQDRFTRNLLEQGEVSGRTAVVSRQLALRFGPLDAQAQALIARSSIAELDSIAERLLSASTLEEALGSH